ncbi:hypothetical protein BGE01nite_01690 [Brevifollis gellanilyticus]|uniref:Uncharacterized protein n=2 Tax=Brevifollis gellanilyticus TaxID=748831 RepID=A0A512M2E3_9BACT|nr:hypothetical protein BGE01nite_01690 [Brevifollis gellanilyticus]
MTHEIQIGVKGRILEGDEAGHFILVQNDEENTGGFLILTASDEEMIEGHDAWVEDYKQLEAYFDESHWKIDWRNRTAATS